LTCKATVSYDVPARREEDGVGGTTEETEISLRLRRLEGQIRGIQRMIGEERDCEAIITQLMAARAALDGVSLQIVGRHIEECLQAPVDEAKRDRLNRTIALFLKLSPGRIADLTEPRDQEDVMEEGYS
jgi:DNA-binding FrmR family transcriptional regulator